MHIAIGADHRGYAYKQALQQQISSTNNVSITWHDYGTDSQERTDYPLFVSPVCNAIKTGVAERGILLCASGVGMSIAANRYTGIYAALVWNCEVARLSHEDDKSNILVIPTHFVTLEEAIGIIQCWLGASFKVGRYQQRIDMIDAIGGV